MMRGTRIFRVKRSLTLPVERAAFGVAVKRALRAL
jgi:hypothetical protein